MYLSRNIQSTAAHAAVAGASPEETANAVLAIVAGNVVEIEERLIAPRKPRPFL